MRQIAYTSVATSQLGQDDVFRIVEKSVGNNMDRGITGFLIYADGRFFQLIEGEEGALHALLAVLRTDPRHQQIDVLLNEPIAERRFPRWRMQRVGRTHDALAEVRGALTGDGGQAVLRHIDFFLAGAVQPVYAAMKPAA